MDEQESTIILNVERDPLVRAEHGYSAYALDREAFGIVPAGRSHLASSVEGVIRLPQVIFGGLCLKRPDSVLCYCARPGQWPGPKGSVQSAKTGYVLVVYAELDDDLEKVVVFDWDLPVEDRALPGYPEDWADKFGEPLWERK
jgi:hypothetical protein